MYLLFCPRISQIFANWNYNWGKGRILSIQGKSALECFFFLTIEPEIEQYSLILRNFIFNQLFLLNFLVDGSNKSRSGFPVHLYGWIYNPMTFILIFYWGHGKIRVTHFNLCQVYLKLPKNRSFQFLYVLIIQIFLIFWDPVKWCFYWHGTSEPIFGLKFDYYF